MSTNNTSEGNLTPMKAQIHLNGGIEQALLEAVNEDGLLSEKDKERLNYLKSLPQNRAEFNDQIIATCEINVTEFNSQQNDPIGKV